MLLAPLAAQGRINVVTLPGRDTVQLTIYNSVDLTLVKETRVLTFRQGLNRLEFSWANTLIDPTSVEFRTLTQARERGVLRVAGQVDRLAVTQDAVLIADFKTNRPAPRRIEEVPPSYVRQLALYRAVLAKLYPQKSVRAALVWTEVPDLMEISAAALDAALAQVTSAR